MNIYELADQLGVNRLNSLFVYLPLTLWCIKNLGLKIKL